MGETSQPKDGPPWELTAHVTRMKKEHMDKLLKFTITQIKADEERLAAWRD
jgi:hypothetical protein